MAAKWLYSVTNEGVRVTPEFMVRLQNGNAAALRALQKQNLSSLYRTNFTRAPRRDDAHGLFWSDIPTTALIPFVRGGRSRNRAWLPDSMFMSDKPITERRWKAVLRMIRLYRRHLRTPPKRKRRSPFDPEPWEGWTASLSEHLEREVSVKIGKGGKGVTVTNLKPNPMFELVVVNRFDKAALLKLLDELDGAANVEQWLTERTVRQGATAHKTLHSDYAAWCEERGEAASGAKNFAQAMIAAGVVKLTRSNAAQRYQLELR